MLTLKLIRGIRYENITYSTMQKTLRYMTKLDRAETGRMELDELSQYFRSLNISATELFSVLNTAS